MIYVGIDPGKITMGYSILDDEELLEYGHLVADSSNNLIKVNEICQTIIKYKPEILYIEINIMQNSIATRGIAEVIGVIKFNMQMIGCKVIDIYPSTISKVLLGGGKILRKDKKELTNILIYNKYPITKGKTNQHERDSIAIAMTGRLNGS